MAKQVIRYRTCDMPHRGEAAAAVTDKLTFNGSRYDIDLCEQHSLELVGAIMRWADVGTKTGDTGIFDQLVEARPDTASSTWCRAPSAVTLIVADGPYGDFKF